MSVNTALNSIYSIFFMELTGPANSNIPNTIRTDLATENRRKIFGGLSPLNFRAKQADISNKTVDGTGKWLLDHDRFVTWLNDRNGKSLWLNGPRMMFPLNRFGNVVLY
jgi:hypothetical protein